MKQTHWFKLLILIFGLSLLFNRPGFLNSVNAATTDDEIQTINDQISANKKKLDDLQAQQKAYLQKIQEKQTQKNTLANELGILSDHLAKSRLDLEANNVEIDHTNLEIKKTSLDIVSKEQTISQQKTRIASLLQLIYQQQQASDLEILLLNDSLSDFVNQLKYLQNTNTEISQGVVNLQKSKSDLEDNQKLLLQKQAQLGALNDELENKKAAIESDQQDTSFLLTKTQMSEKQYQALLTQARQEQLKAENEVAGLERTMREKLAKLKTSQTLNYAGIIWPVPKNRITTGFHDPEYPFRSALGEHPAIDIRSPNGTAIKAAADGYVARSTFNGTKSYAYIMIVHADGLSTVYGHVSASYVKADDYVVQGQIIGRSGGIPGAAGAGAFCTGPHLHFEVRKDGLPVDPEAYLP